MEPETNGKASKDAFLELMEGIWAAQKARGHVPRTKEEIDAQIQKGRDESEEEIQAAIALHMEGRRARAEQEATAKGCKE